jgi:methylenetetrahydrofolate dehydrogenase (NADP+)/methenyltetrahydrofolate cyclohydrolase
MPALILDTRTTAATIREEVKANVAEFKQANGYAPGLVLVSIGEDLATYDYIRVVTRNAVQVGIRAYAQVLPADISASELREHLEGLNEDKRLQAISLQTPLPPQLNLREVATWLDPYKDVEGLHPLNVGHVADGTPLLAPPPALGAMKLLSLYNINPAGRTAVVIGRNPVIGKPVAALLTAANATVTVCHRQTPYLTPYVRNADLLITGVQQPGLVKAEMVKPGAVVIDFGINYLNPPRPRLVGDVEFESVRQVASAITPMPGGTGPLTVVALLQNVLRAANLQNELKKPA